MLPDERRTRYVVGRVPIDALTRDGLTAAITAAAADDRTALFTYLNAHNFHRAWHDRSYGELLSRFDLVFCDGVGLRLGLRLLGVRLPQRMTPPDFVDRIFDRLAATGRGVYLLGDESAVVAATAVRVEERWPGLVRGHHHGFFAAGEVDRVAGDIAASGRSLVLAGLGSPRQERLMVELAPRLGGAWLAVGGLFRWYSGFERRGPRWLTDHGFEWLCRLVVQRRRVASRYLLGLPRFAALLLRLRLLGPRPERIDDAGGEPREDRCGKVDAK